MTEVDFALGSRGRDAERALCDALTRDLAAVLSAGAVDADRARATPLRRLRKGGAIVRAAMAVGAAAALLWPARPDHVPHAVSGRRVAVGKAAERPRPEAVAASAFLARPAAPSPDAGDEAALAAQREPAPFPRASVPGRRSPVRVGLAASGRAAVVIPRVGAKSTLPPAPEPAGVGPSIEVAPPPVAAVPPSAPLPVAAAPPAARDSRARAGARRDGVDALRDLRRQ